MIRDVKVIPGEECVTQHHLLIGDLIIQGKRKTKRKFVPKLRVWKLKESSERARFADLLKAKSNEISETAGVDGKWTSMRNIWLNATEEVCGWTKGPARHKETWWWNEDVANKTREKKKCYKEWRRTRAEKERTTYKEAKKNARKAVAEAKELKRVEFASELDTEDGKRNVFRIAKQMAKERQDVVGGNCLKNGEGKLVIDSDGIKDAWKKYMERLLNEENNWDKDTTCDKTEGPMCRITQEEVRNAIRKMKKGKAAGSTGVVSEMIKAADELGVEWLTDLCNTIVCEGKIPTDWKRSILIPVFKGKGDPLECGSYRAIKLLEHAMKVVERVLEKRIREQVKVDKMQFGFMPGKGTTDAIFVVRQMQERHQKKKKLYYAFVDLEKAFDRVPREVTRWALRKAGVEEWLVKTVMAMYEEAWTVVRTLDGESAGFEVKVGLHQGSVLSPLLFVTVMEVVTREVRGGLPWELLYADDLVLISESEDDLKKKFMKWKLCMEVKGLKVNLGKTKVMFTGEGDGAAENLGTWPCGVCCKGVGRNSIQCTTCQKWIHKRCSDVKGSLQAASTTFTCRKCLKGVQQVAMATKEMDIGNGNALEKVGKFCYLGDMLNEDGGADSAVVARVRCAWKKFRELSSILTLKGASLKLKGKVYESCVRSCMVYGSESWPMKANHEAMLERTEMRMIRWMCGVSKMDRKTSSELRERLGVEAIGVVIRRNRLRWFGHVERKENTDWVKRCMEMEVVGQRPRGRPRKTWMEVVRNDMKKMGLRREDAQDRNRWKRGIRGKTGQPG
jgi:hypothetical protein